MAWWLLLIYTCGTCWGGAHAFNKALLALWLIVLDDDTYMAKWYILIWVVHLIWFLGLHCWCLDHICDWWCMLTWWSSKLDDGSLILLLSYAWRLCRIPIVLGDLMDEDCWWQCWIHKAGSWGHDDDELLSICWWISTPICWLMQIFPRDDTWMILLIRWLYTYDFMMWFKRMNWFLYVDTPWYRTFAGCWSGNSCTRV